MAYYLLGPWTRLSTRKLVFTQYYGKEVESVQNGIVHEGRQYKIGKS